MQRSAFLLLAISVCLQAQFRASITGKVVDPSGAVVPGAKISVTNLDTNRVLSVVSGDAGLYRASELPPGRYSVAASAKGFKKASMGPVDVRAEEPRTVDISLEPGDITQTVTVTAEGVGMLRTENANVSSSITTAQIQELPQYGRDPYELLRTAPGILGDGARSGSGGAITLPNTTGPGGSNSSICWRFEPYAKCNERYGVLRTTAARRSAPSANWPT